MAEPAPPEHPPQTETKIQTTTATVSTSSESVFRDQIMGIILSVSILLMGGLAIFCVFKPPQEWQLVNTVIANLDRIALMILSAHFALKIQKP